ncbi:MAG: Co2+/Mg2+ efflux protein ApaG [Alphaproteobacteria bacterium]
MFCKTTRGITVSVQPTYLASQSSPDENRFVWAYHIVIENQGDRTVRLIARHWRITDEHGQVEDVRGQGVVGEQPTLNPGERFEYTSGAPLATPSGIMVGTYQMETVDGDAFDVAIPAFSLDSPHETRRVH